MQDLSIERTKPPTYLFSNQRFQRAQRQIETRCALTFGAPRLIYLYFYSCVSLRLHLCLARLAPRWCISAPPVKGYLRRVTETCKCFFSEK